MTGFGHFAVLGALFMAPSACSRAAPSDSRSDADAPRPTLPRPSATTAVDAGAPAAPKEASLYFVARDAATGEPIPCKVTFVGVHGTVDPAFTSDDQPLRIEGGIAAYTRVFSKSGRGAVKLRHGSYDVHVTRGPEWSEHVQKGVRVGGAPVSIEARLSHVVDTPGWLSGDFHVHAEPSYDSDVPLEARVYEFVAEGVDLIVSTDHNVTADYAPAIAELGAGALLTSIVGTELTTVDWGHFGAFPLAPAGRLPIKGAHVSGRPPSVLFPQMRTRSPRGVIDVHHPRLGRMGYFDRGRFESERAHFGKPGASLDFDAVEVLNGFLASDRVTLDTVMQDWFALLRAGRRVTGMGNSDTHHLHYNLAGYPRNYVRLDDDLPAGVTPRAVADAVRAGHVIFSTGPFVRLRVDGRDIGDLAKIDDGLAHGDIEVLAAPWIDVARVRIYLDGRVHFDWAVTPSSETSRFHRSFELPVGADGFVVARADGDRTLGPSVGEGEWFRVYPLAVTNPIYLDADGDGRCTRGLQR